MALVCALLQLYVLVLIARAIMSFFPVSSDGFFYQVQSALAMVTEPVLAPLRRVIPPLGMFDLSFLVLVIGIQVLQGVLCG